MPNAIIGKNVIVFSNEVCLFENEKKIVGCSFDSCNSITDNAFFVLKSFDEKCNSLCFLPLMVSIGSSSEISEPMLNNAISSGIIECKESFSLIGSVTRSIERSFELSVEPYIPSVSNNEVEALKFLSLLNLDPNKNLNSLDISEVEAHNIYNLISSKNNNLNPMTLISKTYLLKKEMNNDPLKDLNEFKLFFEACICLNKPSIAVSKCLSPSIYKNRAINLVKEFRLHILKVIEWFYNIKDEIISKSNSVVIAVFKENIDKGIIPVACKYIYSNFLKDSGKILVFSAERDSFSDFVIFHNKDKEDFKTSKFIDSVNDYISNIHNDKGYIQFSVDNSLINDVLDLININLDGISIKEISQ